MIELIESGGLLGRIIGLAVVWLFVFCAAIYALDWAVWQVRMLTPGGGTEVVSVGRIVVAPLKGGREEYYPDGRVDVRCSVSLLPQGIPQPASQPCWWVRRHPVLFER